MMILSVLAPAPPMRMGHFGRRASDDYDLRLRRHDAEVWVHNTFFVRHISES